MDAIKRYLVVENLPFFGKETDLEPNPEYRVIAFKGFTHSEETLRKWAKSVWTTTLSKLDFDRCSVEELAGVVKKGGWRILIVEEIEPKQIV